MITPRIHTDTAIEWAKTKTPDELRGMIVGWSKPTSRKEYWKHGFHFVIILVLLASIPVTAKGGYDLHWGWRAGAFLVAIVLWFRSIIPIQRDLNSVATAEYALKLKEQLISADAPNVPTGS